VRQVHVSVNMLSEGWDVQGVSHIFGLRALGVKSPMDRL